MTSLAYLPVGQCSHDVSHLKMLLSLFNVIDTYSSASDQCVYDRVQRTLGPGDECTLLICEKRSHFGRVYQHYRKVDQQ